VSNGEMLARTALQLMDEGKYDEWEQTMEPDCVFVGPGSELHGRQAMRQFVEGFRRAFPDVQHSVESVYTSGDSVIVELTFAGTHSGPFRTPSGEIPPTGKSIRIRQAQVVEMKSGKAISIRAYFDRMQMMEQLGLVPT